MTTHTANIETGDMTVPTGTGTIMTSITPTAIIATGEDNGQRRDGGVTEAWLQPGAEVGRRT